MMAQVIINKVFIDTSLISECELVLPVRAHWLEGNPPGWDMPFLHESCRPLIDAYYERDASLTSTLWAMALKANARSKFLYILQVIFNQLIDPSRSTAHFDLYGMNICFHLQVLVASLDVRSAVAKFRTDIDHRPSKWLRRLLSAMHPAFLDHLLYHFDLWCCDISTIASGGANRSILYSMWTRSDSYIGKANLIRTKHNANFAGAPMRLMEHWEGLCLASNPTFHRPRYKIFRR